MFTHSSYATCLVNLHNLPVMEMTPVEHLFYQDLSSSTLDGSWSTDQLFSVSMLDGILAIIDQTRRFDERNAPPDLQRCQEWRETLNAIREQARDRWILDEKLVLSRTSDVRDLRPATSIAKRRSFFEERLTLSIVDKAGGFIQIDGSIYPIVKSSSSHQLYLNLADVPSNLLSSSMLISSRSVHDDQSSLSTAYQIVVEQAQANAQWNVIHHGRHNSMEKIFPSPQRTDDEPRFLSLHTLLHRYWKKHPAELFIQLFESSAMDDIRANYKDSIARQFIRARKRRAGLINGSTPCLVEVNGQMWMADLMRTSRTMNDDERLFLNMILLSRGSSKGLLSKQKHWYLRQITDEQENLHLELLF